MPYDAAAASASLEKPSIRFPPESRPLWQRLLGLHRILGPIEYEGRILSHPEWTEEFRDDFVRLERQDEEEFDHEFFDSLARRYIEAIDLRPTSWIGRVLPFLYRDPVDMVMDLEPGVLVEAIGDFLKCQRRAGEPRRKAKETDIRPARHEPSSPSGTRTRGKTA